ncbi:hypothetical protein SAMN02745116_01024 [Pilibacter termitis]|uniref:Uncharacterized protein n=1 Tax=Pilibacter termitis TaxID=263852 RepID=A0A1T4MB38_9ENTE|nr:RNA helicase [Pilibacter termitis]SJZ64091.1 hypothetical protein SAMN02745116_01024 [Pilibacter termitis]
MDKKRLIHAVAGSGKTKTIIDDLDIDKRNLIITYTTTNQEEIRKRVINKYGQLPERTYIFGFFEFLYKFCLVPYYDQRFLGIDFNYKPKNNFDKNFFNQQRVIHFRLSNFLINKSDIDFLGRIDYFFDCVYIDEVQDFESYDFDWIKSLSNLNAKVWLLGDFYQKTYSTSRDGNKGSGIHKDRAKWLKELESFELDETSLMESYRCPANICDFVREKMKIQIFHHDENTIQSTVKFIDNQTEIDCIMSDDKIKKLFYQKSYNYNCNGQNWGDSKGGEFSDVCVILNPKTLDCFKKEHLSDLVPQTKNKFYVACTRTKGNLYFISEESINEYKKE